MLGENHKQFPFYCSVVIEVFFIPIFFSSFSSHITSQLLPIVVKFPVKLLYFCQHTENRQGKHVINVNDSPRQLSSIMLIYFPILHALTFPKGSGICSG